MALTLRTPQGMLAQIKEIQDQLGILKGAVADWMNTGPEAIWLHFDSIEIAKDSIALLASSLPAEVTNHLSMQKSGLSIEDQFQKRRGASAKDDDLDMKLMTIRDPDARTRKSQKAMLDAARKERKERDT